MGSKKTRIRNGRRDRRKAKASGWRRAGTSNPKKVGHHAYTSHISLKSNYTKPKKTQPPEVERWSKAFGNQTIDNQFGELYTIRDQLPRNTYLRRFVRFCRDLFKKLRKKL